MSFLDHVLILVVGLVAFAWVPVIWRRSPAPMSSAVQGIPCRFTSQRVSRSNQTDVTVKVPCDTRFQFTLRREQVTDKVAKTFGLVREFQTRDDRFDAAVYVGADERGVDEWLAQDETARQLVLDLLTLKPEEHTEVRSIVADAGAFTLAARCKPSFLQSAPDDLDMTVATACVPAMKQCVDRLQGFAAQSADPDAFRDRYAARIRALRSLTLGLAIVPILVYFLTRIQRPAIEFSPEVFDDSTVIKVVGVGLGILAVVGFALLRGSARLHTVLVPLLLSSALGLAFGVSALVNELNEQWDSSTPQPHVARVIGRYESHGRRSDSYHLTLASADGGTMKLDVKSGVYNSFRQGDEVTVWERTGYLNLPWISDLRPGSSGDAEGDRTDPGVPAATR